MAISQLELICSYLPGPFCRRLPLAMPVKVPELFQFHQLAMVIGESHIHRAGQRILAAKVGKGW
jgi:hypothetical protein